VETGKTSGNIAFTPICNAELQESQAEEIINLGESQEYEVESAFSENATFEIHDPAPTAHLRAPKRKRGISTLRYPTAHLRAPKRKRGISTLRYQEEMISLENKKLRWLIKHEEENDEI
jgi:hypothetical protein